MKRELIDTYKDNDGNVYEIFKTEVGTMLYYRNGVFHREDGPAIIDFDGGQTWFFDGKVHREEGPAITEPDGTEEYWIHGELKSYKLPPYWEKLKSGVKNK